MDKLPDDEVTKIDQGEIEARILSSNLIASELTMEFFGLKHRDKGHWPEWEFGVLQQFNKEVNGEMVAITNEELISTITRTEFWRSNQELRNIMFNEEQVRDVLALNDALLQTPELADMILSGVYEFQRARMDDLKVPPASIDIAIAHEKLVEELVLNPADGKSVDPIARFAASYHDWIKYSATKQFLGLHESASAIGSVNLTNEIFSIPEVRVVLMTKLGLEDNDEGNRKYDKMVKSTADFVAVTIANHGEGEFPQKFAKGNAISEEDGLYKLFGTELYVNNYREMSTTVDGTVDQTLVDRITRISEGLRAADMLVGTFNSSFVKFHQNVSKEAFFKHNTSKDYIFTFYPNFTNDYFAAPPEMNLRESAVMEDQRVQGEFLFALAKFGNMDLDERKGFEDQARTALGVEEFDKCLNNVNKMKLYFDLAKNENDQQKKNDSESKSLCVHKEEFQLLVGNIETLDLNKLKDPSFRALNQAVLAQ